MNSYIGYNGTYFLQQNIFNFVGPLEAFSSKVLEAVGTYE